jgi:hypothetical protein
VSWRFRNAPTAEEFCYHVRKWCDARRCERKGSRVDVAIVDEGKFREAVDLARCFQGRRVIQ